MLPGALAAQGFGIGGCCNDLPAGCIGFGKHCGCREAQKQNLKWQGDHQQEADSGAGGKPDANQQPVDEQIDSDYQASQPPGRKANH